MTRNACLLLGLACWSSTAQANPFLGAPDSGRVEDVRRVILRAQPRHYSTTHLDVAVGNGFVLDRSYSAALAGWQMWGVRNNRNNFLSRFSYGAGLRATHFQQARAQSFAGRADAKGQELLVNDPRTTAVNAAVQIRLRLLGQPLSRHPLVLGFNIDLGGISFGPARQGVLTGVPLLTFSDDIRPVRTNILLGNINDRGTLNSEFFLDLRATRRLHTRLSFSHIASGYTINGNRYQRFNNLAALGLSYSISGDWQYY